MMNNGGTENVQLLPGLGRTIHTFAMTGIGRAGCPQPAAHSFYCGKTARWGQRALPQSAHA